jgi:ribosomal protein S27AE
MLSEVPAPQENQPDAPAAVSVTLKLPADVATMLSQRAKQLGQLPSQVLVEALRLGLSQLESPELHRTAAEWQQVQNRLAELEALVPTIHRLQALVEQLLEQPRSGFEAEPFSAFPDELVLTAATSATAPADGMTGHRDRCPRCDHRLGPPLKASGRQVCGKCGWSDKPRPTGSSEVATDVPPDDLSRLLAQAAQESLNNMKPKSPEPNLPQPRRRSLFPQREN